MVLIPLTILGSLGVVFIVKFIDSTTYINQRHKKYLSYFFIGFLTLLLFVYVHPFYRGNLIGPRGHVKMPDVYVSLSKYLKENYPSERIYLAPEANSLYFRSFDWGFFGSSFLNYLIPNPIIEKALVTGSYENETAQKVIEQAYYSQNPLLFSRALRFYKTPLILLDESAAPLDNGYFYNWDEAKVSVTDNDLLEKIWSSGKISLYKLREDQVAKIDEYLPLYSNHNFDNLTPILLSQNNYLYYSRENQSGVIFPFALKFDSVSSTASDIVSVTKYHGSQSRYIYKINNEIITNGATRVKFDPISKILSISPAIPVVEVNNDSYLPSLPVTKYRLKDDVAFISVGQDIYSTQDLTDEVVVGNPYSNVGSTIRQWFGPKKSLVFQTQNADKFPLSLKNDTVISWNFSVKSKNDNQISLCAYSNNLFACLNKDKRTLYLKANENLSADVVTPIVASSGDRIDFYITPEIGNDIEILNIQADITEQSAPLDNGQELNSFLNNESTFDLHEGDDIRYIIPKISGSNSYHFDPKSTVNLKVSHKKDCDRNISDGFIRKENRGELIFSNQNCEDYAEVRFEPLQTGSLGVIYYNGENTAGIPLRISVRDLKSTRKTFDDQFEYNKITNKLSLTLFPITYKTYLLELFNYSINPSTVSKTKVDNISFQFIPIAWYQIKLIPENIDIISATKSNKKNELLFSINQATHQNWTLSNGSNAKPVRINGWEQGWIVNVGMEKKVKAFFWPNILVWIGYAVMIMVTVFVFVFGFLKKKKQNSV